MTTPSFYEMYFDARPLRNVYTSRDVLYIIVCRLRDLSIDSTNMVVFPGSRWGQTEIWGRLMKARLPICANWPSDHHWLTHTSFTQALDTPHSLPSSNNQDWPWWEGSSSTRWYGYWSLTRSYFFLKCITLPNLMQTEFLWEIPRTTVNMILSDERIALDHTGLMSTCQAHYFIVT